MILRGGTAFSLKEKNAPPLEAGGMYYKNRCNDSVIIQQMSVL